MVVQSEGHRQFASPDEIASLGQEPIPAYPYYCPDYFRIEVEAIFRRSWLQIGHRCELPERGSFIVRRIEATNASILVTRGADDVLRAFHNVCTHRGSKLVQQSEGRAQAFSCPYHMWNFGFDGALRGAPDFESFHVERAACALKPVAVDSCAGLIFVNLDPHPAQSLREYLGALVERLETFPVARAATFTEYAYEIDANWKLIIDNFQENYHLRFVHARSAGPLPEDNPFGYPAGFEFVGPHGVQTMKRGGGAQPSGLKGFGMANILRYAAADGLMAGPFTADYCVLFPNFFVFGLGVSPFSLHVTPIAVNRSRGVFRFYWTGEDESATRRYTREFHAMMMRDLHAEDLPSILNSQEGLATGALEHIHFQSQEVLCRHFFREVDRRVQAYKHRPQRAAG